MYHNYIDNQISPYLINHIICVKKPVLLFDSSGIHRPNAVLTVNFGPFCSLFVAYTEVPDHLKSNIDFRPGPV